MIDKKIPKRIVMTFSLTNGQAFKESRQAIDWRFIESLSIKKIADRCNKSQGAVQVLLSRTLRQLEDSETTFAL